MTIVKSAVKAVIGFELRQQIRRTARRVRFFGVARYCPCCSSHVRSFAVYGHCPPRPNARCPVCDSLERHRLTTLFMRHKTDLFDGRPKRLLHVAPEWQLASVFRRAPNVDYLSADLHRPEAMVRMDITEIQYPDGAFDVIYCSHVLEHVPDDARAMREFHRVLKPGGWALLQVPITAERTLEDPSVNTPDERLRVYGQADHVRRYGPDFTDRLRRAGFDVTVDGYARELAESAATRFGLMREENVYFCRKS